MNSHDTPEEARELRICGMTVTGSTVAAICSELDISASTVYRTRRRFRQWIDLTRQEIAEQVAAELMSLSTTAVGRLRQLLNSQNDAIALGACRTVLDSAGRWHQDLDVERRLSRLEQEKGFGRESW